MNKIYLRHTTVPADKSVGEIIREIKRRDATRILHDYQSGVLVGLTFQITLPDGRQLPIELPARMEPMRKALYRNLGPRARAIRKEEEFTEEASRIVWRQLAVWVRVQMALIDLEMARPEEIFLPYVKVSATKTMYQAIAEQSFQMKALTSGS